MKYFIYIILFIFIQACSQKTEEIKTQVQGDSLKQQMIKSYNSGVVALENGDVLFAAKKFNEAELFFPQSEWAPKSALMAAYSYYKQDYYGDAVAELNRFLRVYPNHKYTSYAYYLLGISYYEQIVDEKKDSESILNAKKTFLILIKKFPSSEYAMDAEFKLDMINDILASKEMYIGRYYFDKKKWIAAINRFRAVVDNFDQTIYTEEALHRLVEIHYIIGLQEEAQNYAKLLGYNYQSSQWYKRSYIVFDKMYEEREKNNSKKNNSILRKFKSLFE